MNAATLAKYEARARIVKALAHPARIFLVEDLAKHGPQSVGELTAKVGSDISTVSRHLAQLRTAGLLDVEKQGNQVLYRLRTSCILNFFACIEAVLEGNLELCTLALK